MAKNIENDQCSLREYPAMFSQLIASVGGRMAHHFFSLERQALEISAEFAVVAQ